MRRAAVLVLLLGMVLAEAPIVLAATSAEADGGVVLSGVVVDPSDGVVPGANVFLRCDTQGEERAVTTDPSGGFRLDGVRPGTCEIRVQFEGFKTQVRKVKIGSKPPGTLKIVLALASVVEEVTVGNDTTKPTIAIGENRDADRVSAEDLENLPSLDQDYLGTMSRFLGDAATGTSGATLIVDGMEANSLKTGSSGIQEIKINQSPYSAEYARPGRGRIEVITKPAPPEYHGNVSLLFRDYHLDARDPFAEERPPEHRRGGDVFFTGPVLGSKTTSFTLSGTVHDDDLQSVVNAVGPTGPVRGNVATPRKTVLVAGRLTRRASAGTTYSIGYSYEGRHSENQGVGGTTLPEAGTDSKFREDEITLDHRTTLTPHLLNQFRFLLGQYSAPTTSLDASRKVVVTDAFVSGGAQADLERSEHHFELTEVLSYSRGKQLLKAGINIPDWSRRGYEDKTNALGTFYFSSVQAYDGGRPYSFIIQRGDGHLVFLEKLVAGFVQDEIRLGPRLAVSAGLRYDWQNYFHDTNNFNPRFSFAYGADKRGKTVFRGGGGLFHDRSGPQPIADILRYDGERLRRYVLTDPAYPDPVIGSALATPPSIVKLAPDVQLPYAFHYSAGVERQIGKGATLTLTYVGVRGYHLFRSRDLNAPPPPDYAARPDSTVGAFREIESVGRQSVDGLEMSLRGKLGRLFSGMVQYRLGFAYNDTSGVGSFPANNYDLSGEWGRADYDQRHTLNLLGTLTPGREFKIGVALSTTSGRPYSMTTGRDDNNDGLGSDRPAGVGRNTLTGPAFFGLDLRVSRDLFFDPRRKDKGPALTLGLEAFNVPNHVNYASYVGTLSSPFFGEAVSALPARKLQLSARFRF